MKNENTPTPSRPRSLLSLAALLPHRVGKFPKGACPRCGGISLVHQFKISGKWACRKCANDECEVTA